MRLAIQKPADVEGATWPAVLVGYVNKGCNLA